MTQRTLSEISALTLKAVRGAGCSWDVAEEVAHATRTLESHGIPTVRHIVACLAARRQCACKGPDPDAPRCAFSAMTYVSDRRDDVADGVDLTMEDVQHPALLIAPLLSLAKSTGITATLWADDVSATCGPDGCHTSGPLPDRADIRITAAAPAPATHTPATHSRPVDAEVWAQLDQYAAKTLVPDSAASRARGAGDGSTTDS